MIDISSVQRIATALLDARAKGSAADLPAELVETIDVNSGIRIQQLTLKTLNRRIAAWKVAVAPDGIVLAAPVLDNVFFQNGTHVPLSICGDCGLECEIAFRMGRELGPRLLSYSSDEVADSIEDACVTVEVLNSRLPAKFQSPRGAQLADLLSNAALVAGAPTTRWRSRELKNIAFEFRQDGKTVCAREGGHPTGDPFGAVVALANHLSSRGIPLAAGAVVTTGSYSGVHFAPKGGSFTLEFSGFPKLAFTIG
ncbi:MAG TPA: fumarylacetoacetate hydrolase family protein [Pseudorhodoplanes sp.]|nr:fumarylacetoacetate hydrolase family protein [Pseudorhodoplanes sp.]